MKPNFALNLTHDSIGLLHRTARGWLEVGVAVLDAPDLAEALNYLRRSALGLAPHGIATKLVIPNSQILYTELDAPGPNAAQRRAQIRRGLQGRTPYAVEDLVFDWRGTGSTVQVAVVARETLTEAEQFANEYRFNPVSFVAIPEAGKFAGEPWFGPSALAASLLPEGEKVERDQDPITVVARDTPRPEPQPAPQNEPQPAPQPVAAATPEPKPEPKPDATPEPKPEVAPVVVAAPEPAPKPADIVAPPPVAPGPVSPMNKEAAPARPAPETPSAAPMGNPTPETPPPASPAKADAPTAVAKPAPVVPASTAPAPTPPAVSTPPAAELPSVAVKAPAQSPVSVANPPSGNPPPKDVPAFTSRRADEGRAPALGAAKPTEQPAARPAVPPGTSVFTPRPGPSLKPAPLPGSDPVPAALTGLKAGKSDKGDKGQAVQVTAPGIAGLGPRRTKVVPPLPKDRDTTAAQSATKDVFAVRKVHQRGKPRYLGLILTGILLLLLALVAAWSTFYIATSDAPDTVVIGTADTADIPAIEDEMLADLQDPAELTAASSDPAADLAADLGPESAEATDLEEVPADTASAATLAAVDASPSDPQSAAFVATPAPPAPVSAAEANTALGPVSDAQDEIFLASMDAPPPALDAMALPQPDTSAGAPPAAQMPPPPFGTFYQFDANGMIRPTAEGIITPDGVRLVAGRPPVVPPPRPAALAEPETIPEPDPAPAPATDTTAGAITAAPALTAAPSDPALADFRPRSRPEGLVPAATSATTDDDASLAIAADSRLTSLRPHLRPAAVLSLGETARLATEAASLSAAAAATAAPQAETAAPVVLAGLGVSRRPAARPGNFNTAIEAAIAAAVRSPRQNSAAIEPEAEDEPEIVTVAPKIPTRASVAKQATYVNAIKLSQINLIGVYGTASNRSALVRQSNGRYQKVKVGDKLDGGIIAAITATEVRYQKGGRIITLALPKS
ncbi:MAG: translation initiation factor 2 [Pseudorhodobacter sp.]|nr:translation initiation factor 2 [Pseudorhodobacter sp.]